MAMMGGDVRRMYGGDANKAVNAGKTLARFGSYFRKHWVLLIAVVALAVGSTWAQVSTPELTGQVVDCFLTPTASALTGGSFPGAPAEAQAAGNCWLGADKAPNGFTQNVAAGRRSGQALQPDHVHRG